MIGFHILNFILDQITIVHTRINMKILQLTRTADYNNYTNINIKIYPSILLDDNITIILLFFLLKRYERIRYKIYNIII